jgi:hypothetical protein
MIEKNYLRYIIGDPTDVLKRATLLNIGFSRERLTATKHRNHD